MGVSNKSKKLKNEPDHMLNNFMEKIESGFNSLSKIILGPIANDPNYTFFILSIIGTDDQVSIFVKFIASYQGDYFHNKQKMWSVIRNV